LSESDVQTLIELESSPFTYECELTLKFLSPYCPGCLCVSPTLCVPRFTPAGLLWAAV